MKAGEFLSKKWERHFDANDLSKDGLITLEDADIFADRFTLHHNIKGEKAAEFKADFQKVWDDLFLFGRREVDRTTYIKLMAQEYEESRAKFIERHRRAVWKATNLIDVNGDEMVSESEFVIAMKCWGIESLDQKYVQSYPQFEPGLIRSEVFANSWIAFHTNGDENDVELEKPVLFGLRMIDHI